MALFTGKFERYEHRLGHCVTVETESIRDESESIEIESSQDSNLIETPIHGSGIEMIYAPDRIALAETDGRRIYYGDSFLECPPEERQAWIAHELHHITHPNAGESECNEVRDAELKRNGGWEKFSAQYNLNGEWNY